MVKYTIAASLVFAQLAMVAQTSFALPMDFKNGLESRSISGQDTQDLDRRDLTELDKREPFLPLAIAALGGLWWWKHHKKNKEKEAAAAAAAQNNGGGSDNQRRGLHDVDINERDWDDFEKRYLKDLVKRDWDDYELEARGLDFDQLNELN